MSARISFHGVALQCERRPLPAPAGPRLSDAAKAAGSWFKVIGAFCLWFVMNAPAQANSVDVAIVFAVDYSSSIDSRTAAMQREGHATALTSPEIMNAISASYFGCIGVAYFEWSSPGQARVVLPWTNICGPEDARAAAAVIRTKGDTGYVRRARSGTSIASAIDGATLLLDQFPGKAMRKVIDISANGENNDGLPVGPSRSRAIAKGYTINAIAIPAEIGDSGQPLATYFADNVIGGTAAFVIKPSGPADYVTALRRKLVTEISFNIELQRPREN